MATANLCSRRNRHLRCRSTRTARRRYLRFRTRDPQQSRAMSSCTLLFPPRLAHSSSFFPFRRSDLPPSFTSTRFDDGILPTPRFSTRLPSPSSLRRSGSFPTRSGPPQQASSTPVARSSPSTLGAHGLSFSSLPSPQFSPFLLIHLLSSRLFLFLPSPYHPCLRFLRHFTLFFFTFVKSHNVLCHVLS